MFKIDPTVKKETLYISLVTFILSILMQAVFLIAGMWNHTFIWGNTLGFLASVGNFLLMGLTVQKALTLEEKDARKLVQLSQSGRLFMLLIVALIGNFVGIFNLFSVVIPFIFPRIAVMIRPLIKGKE
ncbi:MAG: hypothetical protein IJD97_00865 [Clostridia bacterium]|nr:hypothetical protein [Clostridia bacterium]